MKKKGLIISTIVMVVVLIASLTTATYAWFTSTNSTTVGQISVKVASGSAVVVGVKTTGVYDANATDADFLSGNVEPDSGLTWTSGAQGLSTALNPTFNVPVDGWTQAVATTSAEVANIPTITASSSTDLVWTAQHNAMKANGSGSTLTGSAVATANTDYIHMILGVQASKALDTLAVRFTITPSEKTIVGMGAAVHIAYRLNSGTTSAFTDIDLYKKAGNNTDLTGTYTYASKLADVTTAEGTKYKYGEEQIQANAYGQGSVQYDVTGLNTDMSVINQLEFVVYVNGNDSDCVDAAKGVTFTVNIEIVAVEPVANP